MASDRQDNNKLARTSEGKAASIEALILPTVEDLGLEIVRVALMGDRDTILQIMAERPDGSMSVEDCASLSRALSALLDRPLTRLKDYARFVGFEARVELEIPRDGQRRFRGRLRGVEAEEVLLQDDGAEAPHRLPFRDILRGKLILTDELLATARA